MLKDRGIEFLWLCVRIVDDFRMKTCQYNWSYINQKIVSFSVSFQLDTRVIVSFNTKRERRYLIRKDN